MKRIFAVLIVFAVFLATPVAMNAMGGKPDKKETPALKTETASPALNHQQMVREVLDNLISAYSSRNASGFMSFVADDFTGDRTMLDRDVRKDFSSFTNIDIRYTFNNVTADSTGRMIYASVTFTRSHTIIKTNRQAEVRGSTEFIFRKVNNTLMLAGMKKPFLFGLSGS
jgi:hypothetical protein